MHYRTRTIWVEEWGGNILIRQLSRQEVVKIAGMEMDAAKGGVKFAKFNFELIRLSWIHEDGSPVLTEEDCEWVVSQPNSVIKMLIDAITKFNASGRISRKREML